MRRWLAYQTQTNGEPTTKSEASRPMNKENNEVVVDTRLIIIFRATFTKRTLFRLKIYSTTFSTVPICHVVTVRV